MRRCAKRCGVALAVLLALLAPAAAQQNRGTLNYATKITTGLTYQQLRPAENRWSIVVQNNNATDACYLVIGTTLITPGTTTTASSVVNNGVTMTAAQASILLTAGQSWARFFPYVPNDVVFGTCASTGDSIYVDIQ